MTMTTTLKMLVRMTPDRVLGRLAEHTEQRPFALLSDKLIQGRIRDDGFTVSKRGGRNSFRPVLKATVTKTDDGTLIEGRIASPAFNLGFARFWWLFAVSMALLIGLASIPGLINGTMTADDFFIIACAFGVPVGGVGILGLMVTVSKAEAKFLREFLGETFSDETVG